MGAYVLPKHGHPNCKTITASTFAVSTVVGNEVTKRVPENTTVESNSRNERILTLGESPHAHTHTYTHLL